MLLNYSDNPKNKRRARFLAILWTLLILFLCFIPAREIPRVNVPLIDKWTHFILFGVFAYLWLLSLNKIRFLQLLLILLAAVTLGWLVEIIQGSLSFLGRSKEPMDILADAIGGLIGVFVFWVINKAWLNRIQ